MAVVLFAGSIIAACALAFLCIPADVRQLIGENCHSINGTLKPRYVWREFLAVCSFFTGVMLFAFAVAAVGLFTLLLIDQYVIPLKLAGSAVAQADVDVDHWQRQLKSLPDNVSQQHKQWFIRTGGTAQGARSLQRFLFHAFPLAVCVAFVGLLLLMRFTSLSYGAGLEELVTGCVNRNRRIITKHYLASTAQAQYWRIHHHHH